MPAKSEKQRKLMGAALNAKRGGKAGSKEVSKVAKGMSESQLSDFAKKSNVMKGKDGAEARKKRLEGKAL